MAVESKTGNEKGKADELMHKALSPTQVVGVLGIGILLFTWWLLGWGGLTTLLAMAILYVLPFWLLLQPFELDQVERFVFAMLGGFGVFAYLVYYLNFLFAALRMETYLVGGLLLAAGIYVWNREQKKA